MRSAIAKFPNSPVEKLVGFALKAEKIVNRSLSTLVPPTKGSFAQAIANTAVGSMKGSNTEPMLIHYDHKLSGESSSKPASRPPPHNDDDMNTLLSAVLNSRPDPTTIDDGDQYVWMDGGKPGCATTFHNFFKVGRTVMQKFLRTAVLLHKHHGEQEGATGHPRLEHY